MADIEATDADGYVVVEADGVVRVGRLDVGHLFSHYGASRRSGYVSPAGCFTPSGAAWCAYVALGFCVKGFCSA